MSTTPHLTRHAAARHHERVGTAPSPHALALAIRVPPRHAAARWPTLVGAEPRAYGARIRCSASAAFVCRGRRVVTTIALTPDDLGTLAAWLLTGVWT